MHDNADPIPVPWSNRIRLLLTQQLQGWLFVASVIAVTALWFGDRPRLVLPGQVEMVRVVVPASRDGILTTTQAPLARFDRVRQGVTPLAQIDVTDALLEMQTLTAQRSQLLAELESQRQTIRLETMRWRWESDQERRQRVDQSLQRERTRQSAREHVDQLTSETNRTDQQIRALAVRRRENQASLRQAEIAVQSALTRRDRVDRMIRLRLSPATERESIARELALQQTSLHTAQELETMLENDAAELDQQLAATSKRLADASEQLKTLQDDSSIDIASEPAVDIDDASQGVDSQAMLEPYVQAIAAHDAKIRELANRISANEILAPVSGTVAEIHQRPGTFVRRGDPLMTIASDQRRWIVAYVDQADRASVQSETPVQIRIDGTDTFVTTSTIAELGNQFESVPIQLRRDANVDQWGVPIKVPIPPGIPVTPGQRVELLIQ
ncbi:HlyD family secretion protein [Stieleria maiorica]|uniref:HlyD family secretion protein n=1 Tax=Stieleria maiorica TaxID=2795974 RepID=A0A5B9MJY3_9BACT|nr:HlyD family efflux transporter periplasmic adaptor subunit [Stieleria maiorica]QEG01683.1 HlyD family secretion protein [Stieleria maiorica]